MKFTNKLSRAVAVLFFLFFHNSSFSQINSTAIGSGAFGSYYGANRDYSVHVGYQAGWSGNTGAGYNVLVGYRSGYSTTAGYKNTFLGYQSGYYNTIGLENTFVGYRAGYKTTNGVANVFVGKEAGRDNTSGSTNIFIGGGAGAENTTGLDNIAIGGGAGNNFRTGSYNIFIGGGTVGSSSGVTGVENLVFGRNSGNKIGSGNYNTLLGSHSGYNLVSGSKNVFIGYQAGYSETGSNKLYIANSSTSSPLIWGDFSANSLVFNGSGQFTGSFNPSGGFVSNVYFDDDSALGGDSDDWIRLNGYVEMKSNTDNYGIVLRESGSSDYLGMTQKGGWSYFADSNTSDNYFLRGNGDDVEVKDNLLANSISTANLNTSSGNLNLSGSGWGMDFFIDTDNNSTNYYRWFGNGAEQMRLTDDGKLGIGVVPSSYQLHVAGDIYADGGWLRVNGQRGMYNQSYATHIYANDANYWRTRSDRGMIIANKANEIKGYLYHDNNNSFGLLDGDGQWGVRLEKDTDTRFYINNSEKMRIQADGSVGIGVTTASNLLDIAGGIDINDYVRHNDDDDTFIGFDNNDNIVMQTNGAVRLEVKSDGKVLVGNESVVTTAKSGVIKVSNQENTIFTSELQSPDYTYLSWDRNHNGDGIFSNSDRPMFMYWDDDDDKVGYLIDTRNMKNLNADINALNVINGTINSSGGDLDLQTSGVTAISVSSSNQDVTINNNLGILGVINFNKATIAEDNTQDDLLVMRGDGTLATRSVGSIESPWLFAEILVGTDSMLAICPDAGVIGQISVDVIDLNGNIRFGDNAYIDDDMDYGDDGDNDDIPDDWMKFSDRIEFKSVADGYGIVLFDQISYSDFLNLHHSEGTSYLSNGSPGSNFFLKATGRDVVFGGTVNIPSLETSEYSSSESLTISADGDNNTAGEAIIFGTNGKAGDANFNEILRLEEDGDVIVSSIDDSPAISSLLVRDSGTGKIYSREANTVGPWDIQTGGDIHYDGGNIGLGIPDAATETIDIGSGTIRVRSLTTTATENDLLVVDADGNFMKRNSSTLNLSPWTVSASHLSYLDNIIIGANDAPAEKLDVRGNIVASGTMRLEGLGEGSAQNTLLVADVDGNLMSRDVNTLVGDGFESDKLVVLDASNNLRRRDLSTIMDDINQSAFTDFGTYISYGGSVILDNEIIINTPTAKLDVDGDLRIRSVDRDFANELTDIMMIDADGFLKRRGIDALELSPWDRNGNDLAFTDGKIGIGAVNNSADQQTRIVTNLKTGLNVVTNYTPGSTGPSSGYGILATIDNDNVRAFAVKDVSIAGTTAQRDVFRVWGSGKVEAKEVLVAPDIWYDDVFREDYSLRTINEVEEFVKEKRHLPDVPSEDEILKNGLNLGEMEGLLLKKIEELTLYIIDQNKKLEAQNERIEALENKLKEEE